MSDGSRLLIVVPCGWSIWRAQTVQVKQAGGDEKRAPVVGVLCLYKRVKAWDQKIGYLENSTPTEGFRRAKAWLVPSQTQTQVCTVFSR